MEMKRIDRSQKVRVGFHEAKWDEAIIYELSKPGERGILVPKADKKVVDAVGNGVSMLPKGLRRKQAVDLPGFSQNHGLRHDTRLSPDR